MPVKVTCESAQGGAVELNKAHGVRASYAVVKVGDLPESEILYAGIKLRCGRTVKLFVNRETGLVVLDTTGPGEGASGTEMLRATLTRARPDGRHWVGQSLEATNPNPEQEG